MATQNSINNTINGVTIISSGSSTQYLNAAGTYTSVTSTPGGTSGQIQYNNSGAFGGFGSWDGQQFTNTVSTTGSSGVKTPLSISIDSSAQSGTAQTKAIYVNYSSVAALAGTQSLIDLQVLAGTVFSVTTGGTVTFSGLAGTGTRIVTATSGGVLGSTASVSATQGGTAQTSYTTGDILYASATNVLSKLGIGSSGAPLLSNGTTPAYGQLNLANSSNAVTGILGGGNGGTNNGFMAFSGPATTQKTFSLPNASATILTDNAAVTALQGGTGQSSYAVGDILYANSTTNLTKLGIGTAGFNLKSTGSAPQWSGPNRAYVEYSTNANLATGIPADDTIPQNTEGVQILSASITPSSTTARIRIRVMNIWGTCGSASSFVCAALFNGIGTDAIKCGVGFANTPYATINFEHEYVPGSTSAITFTVRAGGPTGTTIRLNGNISARFYGGVSAASMIVEEIPA